MGNKLGFVFFGIILLLGLSSCQPVSSSSDGVLLPTSVGTSAASTTAPLALPTIIEDTATPLPPEFPDEPGEYYFDDFSNREQGWNSEYTDQAIWDYYQGGYRVSVYQADTITLATTGYEYDNVRLVVDARLIGGQMHNLVGLACRVQDIDKYYAAVITGEGYYAILRRLDEDVITILSGTGNEHSVVINQGLTLNLIELSCVGQVIKLTVNGQVLAEVTDPSLDSGYVGLFVSTLTATSTDVLFDNFYLYLEE